MERAREGKGGKEGGRDRQRERESISGNHPLQTVGNFIFEEKLSQSRGVKAWFWRQSGGERRREGGGAVVAWTAAVTRDQSREATGTKEVIKVSQLQLHAVSTMESCLCSDAAESVRTLASSSSNQTAYHNQTAYS